MKKLVGHDFSSESRIPPSVERNASAMLRKSSARANREPLRCGGRGDHERQHEQDADDLNRLGRRQGEQQEDPDRESAHRQATCCRDVRVDAREVQRPVERGEAAP